MSTPDGSSDLEQAVADSFDPTAARDGVVRLCESAASRHLELPGSHDLALLAPILACHAISSRLAAEPRIARWLTHTSILEDEKPRGAFLAELRARTRLLSAPEDLDRVLRRYRNREMARIALRDLTRRASLKSAVREISHLADALVTAALEFCDARLAARFGAPLGEQFCVVAMGKHGAQELNYSSDIDVLFVFAATAEETPARRAQAVALAQAVIHALSSVTADGFAFRVDANLRPFGRDGPLAQSVDEMERYYERSGRTWERAALIKARPCAGGIALGDDLLERLRGFVFRRTLDLVAVESMAAMKRQIDRDEAHSAHDNVKLGTGGIREIEFFVQALQLLHGGRLKPLRVRSTLAALDALLYAGLLPSQDRDALAEAYVFLRDVEHRLQLPEDRQTHELPPMEDPGARRALARAMGFADIAPFEDRLARHRRAVHERFARLLATAAEESPPRREAEIVFGPHARDADAHDALRALGFEEPELALLRIRSLQRNDDGALGARGRESHPGLAERILEDVARSPDPDFALLQLASVFSQRWQASWLADMLERQPALRRVLVLLFGSSETLMRDLRLQPELLDLLARAGGDTPSRPLADAVRERLARETGTEERLVELRLVRRHETLRIALLDLAGRLRQEEIGVRFTELAEVVIRAVVALAREELAERYGEPPRALFSVIGFGSLGGEEMDYESDLDLVFVYDGSGLSSGGSRGAIEASEWAARLSQRILRHLAQPGPEGVLFRVDARLRPSGRQGALVTSLAAFAQYHGVFDSAAARRAGLWERQALLRARPVAGDDRLCEAIVTRVLDPVAREPAPNVGAEIAQMRYRLDATGPGGGLYPKKGPGGLLDVEFLAQFLEIRHGARIPSTRRALAAAAERGWLTEATADELLRAYELLRRVESRVRLRYSRPDVFVPAGGPGLERLARQLGDAGGDAGRRLWRDLTRAMSRNREIFAGLVR